MSQVSKDIQDKQERAGYDPGFAISLSEVFRHTLHHWPWIAVSLFVCLGVAT